MTRTGTRLLAAALMVGGTASLMAAALLWLFLTQPLAAARVVAILY